MMMHFIYRYDPIATLREVLPSLPDQAMRPKRTVPNAAVPHASLVRALRGIKQDQAVFQISFWKTLDAALKRLPSGERAVADPVVLQRIPTSHPILCQLCRTDDDYMRECAWLFWHVGEPLVGHPNTSPLGIPHGDIEVALPSGEWCPFQSADFWVDCVPKGWTQLQLSEYKISAMACTRTDPKDSSKLEGLVVQRNPGGQALIYTPELRAAVIENACRTLGIRDKEVSNWYIAFDRTDRVEMIVMKPKGSNIYSRLFYNSRVAEGYTHVEHKLSAFGYETLAMRQKRWTYSDQAVRRMSTVN